MASSTSSVVTRTKSSVWLIGQPEENLPENVLPTSSDVLKTFFFHHNILKKTVPVSLKATTEELMTLWQKARIPTAFQPNIISKIKSLVEDYNLLKKNKSRVSEAQKSREKQFQAKIEQLFDVAHKDADFVIKLQEDKEFLVDQRGFRKMKMSGVDKKLALRESRSQERKKMENERKQREEERQSVASTSTSFT